MIRSLHACRTLLYLCGIDFSLVSVQLSRVFDSEEAMDESVSNFDEMEGMREIKWEVIIKQAKGAILHIECVAC